MAARSGVGWSARQWPAGHNEATLLAEVKTTRLVLDLVVVIKREKVESENPTKM